MKKDSSRTTRALIVENSDFKKKTHKTGQSLSDQNMMNHNQTQQDYEATFREMLEGFALHEVICNDKGQPVDYRFLSVNPAFERITGLKANDILGRTVLEVLPGTEHYWIETYGRVALTGEPAVFENYSNVLNKYFMVTSFQPAPNRFACVFFDITQRKQSEDALRESETKYKSLFEHSTDAIFLAYENIFIDCNQKAMEMLGCTKEQIIGHSFDRFMPEFQPDGSKTREKTLKKARAAINGHPQSYELQHRRYDGTLFDTEVSLNAFNDRGKYYIQAIVRDITESKRVQEELLLFKKAIEGSSDAIGMADKQGNHFYQNKAFTNLLGYTAEELRKDGVAKSVYVNQDVARNVFKTIMDGGSWSGEVEDIAKDGRRLTVMLRADAIKDETGKVTGLLAINTDVTERKKTEEALRESEELYTRLVNTIPEVVVRTSLDGKILFVNENAVQTSGYNRQELEGRNLFDFIPPDEHAKTIQNIKNMLEQGIHSPNEYHLITKDGRIIPFEITSDVFRGKDGTPCGFVHVCRNISQRKQAELEKEQLQERLNQAQKMESVGRLAGGVAHDFNNMLSVILGHTELAMGDAESDQPLYTHLLEIRKAAERSADLTRQLLAFARKQTVSPRVIDMNQTVEGMLKMLQRLIGEDIHLDWQPCMNSWPVKVDPSQVDQILANLCVNSRDAIAGVGKISIELGNIHIDEAFCAGHPYLITTGDYILLAVSDDGHGMDREVQNRLFEPFFTTKDIGKGTGLGLSTVYGIVKQNKGFINVYSEPGQGTTFRIYLPRYTGAAEQTKTEQPQGSMIGGHETVLVVEDESSILDLCKIMLEQQGYEVLAAATPTEAIELAGGHSGEIHLLITDMVMPGMNGRDLAKRFLSIYPDMKCLFMSGYTPNMIAHQGILDEGVYFIQKPFSKNDLTTRVREILDQK
jgi:two-component system, cell cycle sensor histidine kinase and response regulator CckA